MTHYEIAVPASIDPATVVAAVSEVVAATGLTITLTTTLASYPGSHHWHLKQGKQSGTLELTWWPAQRRLWLSVQSGRNAPWIEPTLDEVKNAMVLWFDSHQ